MIQPIPKLIHDNYRKGILEGICQAAALFMDISGFTTLTERLMKKGKEGAEVVNTILASIFDPLIRIIYSRNGYITTFAGDAFTALFETEAGIESAGRAALEITNFFKQNGTIQTRFGSFTVSGKVGVSYGNVHWGIISSRDKATYYFRGEAIDGCIAAEKTCRGLDVVVDRTVATRLPKKSVLLPNDSYFVLQSVEGIKEKTVMPSKKGSDIRILEKFLPYEIVYRDPVAEFRTVCSVFIGLRNFKTYESLAHSIGHLLTLVSDLGGYFESLDFGDKGTTVLVLFGVPVMYENIAERAFSLVDAARNKFAGNVRIGCSLGPVFTGIKGNAIRATYGVIGDSINTAARLMTQAPWGAVWFSRPLRKKWERFSQVTPLGKIDVRGKSGSIDVYELDNPKLRQGIRKSRSAFWGREKELAAMLKNFGILKSGRNAGVLTIYGNPGIGKSRVIEEFLSHCDLTIAVLYLRADSVIQKSFGPFTAFFQLFFEEETLRKDECVSLFDVSMASMYQKLGDIPQPHAYGNIRADFQRAEPFLALLSCIQSGKKLFPDLDPQSRYENTLIAIKTFFKAFSLIQPFVLVIEDLQWFDSDSFSALKRLIHNVRDFPFYIVASSRYLDDGSEPDFVEDSDIDSQKIRLTPLEEKAFNTMIEHSIGGAAHPELYTYLQKYSVRNPFYLEQLCAYLKENDLLRQNDDGLIYSIKRPDEIPSDIHALLVARIDRLSGTLKEYVKLAAVIGNEFEKEILLKLVDLVKKIEPAFAWSSKVAGTCSKRESGLLTKEMALKAVEEKKIWSALNEIHYIFEHALLHEAAYDMQLREQLRKFHDSIGQILVDLHGDEPDYHADIAHHFVKSENREKAKEYLMKAGRYAHENFRNDDALRFFQQLLTYAVTIDEEYDYRAHLWDVYENTGKWDEAIDSIQTFLKTVSENKQHHLIYKTQLRLGYFYELQSRLADAEEVLLNTLTMSEQVNDEDSTMRIYAILGIIYNKLGEYKKAERYFNIVLRHNEQTNDRSSTARTLNNIGLLHLNQNKFEKALQYYKESLAIKEELHDIRSMALSYINIGTVMGRLGKGDEALDYFTRAKPLTLKVGNLYGISLCLNNIGHFLFVQGKTDDAIAHWEESYHYSKEMNNSNMIAMTLGNIGAFYNELGQYEKSLEYTDKAIEFGEKSGRKYFLCSYLFNKATCHYNLGQFTEAKAMNEKAAAMAHEVNRTDFAFDLKFLQTRLEAKEQLQRAEEFFLELLSTTSVDEDKILVLDELIQHTNKAEYKNRAASIYQKLFEKTGHDEYNKKFLLYSQS